MSDSKNNDKGKNYSSSDMFAVDAKLLQALASLTPEQRELLFKFVQASQGTKASENPPAPPEAPPVQNVLPKQAAPHRVSANTSLPKGAPPKSQPPSFEPAPPPVLHPSNNAPKSQPPSFEPTPPPVLHPSNNAPKSQPPSFEPTPPPILTPSTNASNQPSPDASPVAPPPVLEIKRRPTRRALREQELAAANMVDLESDAPLFAPRKETRPEKTAHKEHGSRRKSSSSPSRKNAATLFIGAAAASAQEKANALDSLSSLVNAKGEENVSLDSLKLSKAATPTKQASLDTLSNVAAPVTSSSVEDVELLRDETNKDHVKEHAPMWLISLFFHIVLALILMMIVTNVEIRNPFEVISEPGMSDDVVLDEVYDPELAPDPTTMDAPDLSTVETADVPDEPDVSAFEDESAAALTLTDPLESLEGASLSEMDNLMGSFMGDDLSGRGKNKAAALAAGGGTEGSEKSVALALAWLAEHQCSDGSWHFNLYSCPSCGGKCMNSGMNNSTIAATSMGLLPFLAAGHTPTTGKYKRVVAKGMNYLLSQGNEDVNGVSFRDSDGSMYSHGLAAIAICETYAMMPEGERKRYRLLGEIANETTRYIEYAQAADGGWRYAPKQAGDTSVSGWQIMALQAARLAALPTSSETFLNARSFLRDEVAISGGERYSYLATPPLSEGSATTAIGLLCRLYLDWDITNPTLLSGANIVAKGDRTLGNPYFLYYASQLLYNVGGSMWDDWNREMREKLIAAQCMDGHERGSWFPENPDSYCTQGGRLYATAFNCLILEVYYRHMPLFQKIQTADQFPIETLDDSDLE